MTERLLRYVVDGDGALDEVVTDVAASPALQAETVQLATLLANLPGDGARAAEARLDQLLEAVSLVAVAEIVAAREPIKAS